MFGLLSLGDPPNTERFLPFAVAFAATAALFLYVWCLILGITAIRERSLERNQKVPKCENLFVMFLFTTIVVAMVAMFAIVAPFQQSAVPSDDAGLSSLESSHIALNPTFSPKETRYSGQAGILSRTTDVEAVARADGATVRIIVGGKEQRRIAIPADPRDFTILIIVTAPDRIAQKVYEVRVNR